MVSEGLTEEPMSQPPLNTPFGSLVGQPQAIELLTQAVQRQRIAPAYLFAGPDGVGRSLAARGFSELLLSPGGKLSSALRHRIEQHNHPDLLWVEPTYLHQGKRLSVSEATAAGVKRKTSPVIRLEQVREIAQFLGRSPLEAPRSIVVIEQAETMAEAPANGLLKTLEEPGQATLILLAPSVESLLPTLVSRCQRIPFYRLSADAMAHVLQQAGHAEIVQHPAILQLAQGSPGAAITHWQQLQELSPELLIALSERPRSIQAALSFAREIDKTVELDQQHWLIDYLQQTYWQQISSSEASPAIHHLEQARLYLRRHVQSRLVWEVTLMSLVRL